MKTKLRVWSAVLGLSICLLACGCATTPKTDQDAPNTDPWESYNRAMFKFNDNLDRYVLKPVAKGYKAVMPGVIDDGVTNVFSNLNDVVVFANAILQGKFDQAVMDSARVVANTSFGVLGFFDVASRMDLPKHNEDFGQTLGVWGVGSGPYFVLPFLGPSSARDAPGIAVDWFAFSPLRWLNPTVRDRVIALILEGIDTRADLLRVERALEGAVLDRYIFIREAYLQRRLNLVHDGNPPEPEFEDFEDFEDLEGLDEEALEPSTEAVPSEAPESS